MRVGGVDEKLGETGISHMLEHMAFKGTSQVGTTDYARERKLLAELELLLGRHDPDAEMNQVDQARLQSIRSELDQLWSTDTLWSLYERRGASGMNATTGKDLTKYMVSLPRPAFEFWCWMESERILDPVMRQFYKERDVVLEERFMRYENSPAGKLYEQAMGVTYGVHPYRNPVIGYEYDLKRLRADRTLEFQRRYYVPSNIVVSVVGAVEPERDIETIERYFGRLEPGASPPRVAISESAQLGEKRVVVKAPASPQLIINYRKEAYPHPDDAPISIMLEMLAGTKISPMYEELVKRRKIAVSISYHEGPGFAYPNLAAFYAVPRAPHTNQQLLQAFDRVVHRFVTRPKSEELLEVAKRHVATMYLDGLATNMSLALDLVSSELIYSAGWEAIVNWHTAAMQVSIEDVQRVAAKYLAKERRTVALLETAS